MLFALIDLVFWGFMLVLLSAVPPLGLLLLVILLAGGERH
jgi:hypothetical protein